MTEQVKNEIKDKLEAYVTQYESQAKAAKTLKEVSEATIIQMLKGRFEGISDDMWRVVGKQVGYTDKQRPLVETESFNFCLSYYKLAKKEGETFALVGPSGCGKTHAAKWFVQQQKTKNVYWIECANYLNPKDFLMEIVDAMGKTPGKLNINELVHYIIAELRKQDRPLIILDEIDKLQDYVLIFFITLYNKLHDLCGFVWQSTDVIKQKFERNANKMGYPELKSRISKFYEIPIATKAQHVELCKSRGITNEEDINRAWNEDKGNVRRVDRLRLKYIDETE